MAASDSATSSSGRTRQKYPGDVVGASVQLALPAHVKTAGGLHLHHLVWGIVLLMLSGFLRFVTDPATPWAEILAAAFGIGAGLTLDEFALWIHLRDVYWSEEGR